eukprot:TRINITY_DN28487_c0_g1_i1.p1 TRINITY_DN28487_c0_g1~~TRINITY_DN28487_c0_g1_i1.p1  ORF type:complete len:801 (-),score=169.67 TRINITY_DN28487_c0_g1_i1:213-2615(-)
MGIEVHSAATIMVGEACDAGKPRVKSTAAAPSANDTSSTEAGATDLECREGAVDEPADADGRQRLLALTSVGRSVSSDLAVATGRSRAASRAALDVVGDNEQCAYQLLMSQLTLTAVDSHQCKMEPFRSGVQLWLDSAKGEDLVMGVGAFIDCFVLRVERGRTEELRLFALEPVQVWVFAPCAADASPPAGWDAVALQQAGSAASAGKLEAPRVSKGDELSAAELAAWTHSFEPGSATVPLQDLCAMLVVARLLKKSGAPKAPANSRLPPSARQAKRHNARQRQAARRPRLETLHEEHEDEDSPAPPVETTARGEEKPACRKRKRDEVSPDEQDGDFEGESLRSAESLSKRQRFTTAVSEALDNCTAAMVAGGKLSADHRGSPKEDRTGKQREEEEKRPLPEGDGAGQCGNTAVPPCPKRRLTGAPAISAEEFSRRYKLLSVAGRGAFGTVHQAEPLLDDLCSKSRRVAVKIIKPDAGREMREIELMHSIRGHPCIVSLLEAFSCRTEAGESALHVVMDFYPETLHAKIGGTPLPVRDVQIFSFQLLRALAHLQGLSICHRDIKPENVLLDGPSLRLADFGSAKVLDGHTGSSSYICSRWWRAPELVLGNVVYSTSIDWWSCGCVIAEMMLGKALFMGGTSWGQMYEIIRVLGTPKEDDIQALVPAASKRSARLRDHLNRLAALKREGCSWAAALPTFADDDAALELPAALLVYDPTARRCPAEVLMFRFFDDLLADPSKLPPGFLELTSAEFDSCGSKEELRQRLQELARKAPPTGGSEPVQKAGEETEETNTKSAEPE